MSSSQESQDPASGNEMVFTVDDYYDGPLKGIANFQGKPHFYERIFDSATDDYSDIYRLTPIDDRIFRLAMEEWEIWRRWEVAFHAGRAKMGSHPALPEDVAKYDELKRALGDGLHSSPNAVVRTGKFSVIGPSDLPRGVMRALQVQWTNP
jgi:hypothetical protein